MFLQLRLKNFKAWQGEHCVDLAPISLFLGTNSAGKTSLLQMLLLLKQTSESPDRRQHLNLGGQLGDLLHLGSYKDIISGHDVKRELSFGLRFSPPLQRSTKQQRITDYDVTYCQALGGIPVVKTLEYTSGGNLFKAVRGDRGAYLLTATVPTSGEKVRVFALAKELNLESQVLVDLCKELSFAGVTSQLNSLEPDQVETLKERIKKGLKPIPPSSATSPLGLSAAAVSPPALAATEPAGGEPKRVFSPLPSRQYEPERSVTFSAAAVAALGLDGGKVQDLALQTVNELNGIIYLGPLREQPRRTYPWNQQTPGNLGQKGEFAIHALLASANDRAKRTEKGGKGWLVERVSHWLKTMEVADGLSLKQEGSSVHYEILVHQGKTKANIVDVGFGVSQVLPVVTLAYFAPEGSTVIIEQPEIHLHPLAQTVLADLFVEVSRERRVQFLVETHSENLFRRLQFLIADERTSPEECRLYFVKRGDESAVLNRLEVDEYGRIKNWPERFFGDAIGEVERQTRRMIEAHGQAQRSLIVDDVPPNIDYYIIDTNVLLVASGLCDHISIEQQQTVLHWLLAFRRNGQTAVVLDHLFRIWDEYHNKLTGQDLGLLIVTEKLQSSLLRNVEVKYDGNGHGCLPPELENVIHDLSDRKFVAVAYEDVSSGGKSTIVNAVDRDWCDWEESLRDVGITVNHLIEDLCQDNVGSTRGLNPAPARNDDRRKKSKR